MTEPAEAPADAAPGRSAAPTRARQSPAPGRSTRRKRRHAAELTRIFVGSGALSVFLVLVCAMGPLVAEPATPPAAVAPPPSPSVDPHERKALPPRRVIVRVVRRVVPAGAAPGPASSRGTSVTPQVAKVTSTIGAGATGAPPATSSTKPAPTAAPPPPPPPPVAPPPTAPPMSGASG